MLKLKQPYKTQNVRLVKIVLKRWSTQISGWGGQMTPYANQPGGDKSLSSARLLGKLSMVADIKKQGIFS